MNRLGSGLSLSSLLLTGILCGTKIISLNGPAYAYSAMMNCIAFHEYLAIVSTLKAGLIVVIPDHSMPEL